MPKPIHRSPLTLCFAVACLCAAGSASTALAEDDPFVGYWRNDQLKSVYRITRGDDGGYRVAYGFDQAGVWGRVEARREGDTLRGTFKSNDAEGEVVVSPWQSRRGQTGLEFDWRAKNPRNGGKVYAILTDRDPATTPLEIDAQEQAWRYGLIRKYAEQAQRERMSLEEWTRLCQQARAEITQAGKWRKGWFLPSHLRSIGWTDWEIGWLEIYFLEATSTWTVRDQAAPESKLVHHRFHDPAESPLAGYHTRAVTSYRETNDKLLDAFRRNMNGRASVSGPRLVSVHYAVWEHLTANESRGVIARPVLGDLKRGEPTRVALYNDSHLPVRGRYALEAFDGDRKLTQAQGTVEIAPYAETLVDLDEVNPYAFFTWHIVLDFVPEGYSPEPIAKDALTPFHEMVEGYASVSTQADARLDFLDAVRWARVPEAWASNDRRRYARAVRDAGGRLYHFCGKEPAVRDFMRRQLEAIEQPGEADKAPRPDLSTGETELTVSHNPRDSQYVDLVLREIGRLDPEAIAAPEKRLDPENLRERQGRLQAREGAAGEPRDVKLKARFEGGYLYLQANGYDTMFTGYVTLYDGGVDLGTYPLDGAVNSTIQRIPVVTSERLVTFYQPELAYKIELRVHRHAPPSRGGAMYYNFWEQLNRALPGARPFPRPR